MGLGRFVSRTLGRIDDSVVGKVSKAIVAPIKPLNSGIDSVGDRLFGNQGSGNRTTAAVVAGAALGGLAAAGQLGTIGLGGGLGSGSVAPGLAAATGQSAAQIAATSAAGVSTATPAALAAATTGTGIASTTSALTLAGVLGSAKTGIETIGQVAGTVGVIKALRAGGGAPAPDVNIAPGDVIVPGMDGSGGGGIVGGRVAPTVEVRGRPDNTFWILLAAGAALIWKLK